MTPTPRLVLFGNSVFLAGIKAQLKTNSHAELITVGTADPNAADLIRRGNPTAVIFDLSLGYPDFAVSVLKDKPGLLLIGLMPSSDDMFLISSRYARAQSLQDLFQAVNGLPDSNREHGYGFDAKWLRSFIACATAFIPTRQQKLASAVTVIGLCSILVLVLGEATGSSSSTPPLAGTVLGEDISPEIALAFGIGIILGAVGTGAWFYLRQARKNTFEKSKGADGY